LILDRDGLAPRFDCRFAIAARFGDTRRKCRVRYREQVLQRVETGRQVRRNLVEIRFERLLFLCGFVEFARGCESHTASIVPRLHNLESA
jgi:hypothetical protein